MVWGAMIALSAIALETADTLYLQIDLVLNAVKRGTVITVDNGIAVLAKVASRNETYETKIVPYLVEHLQTCRAKELGQHAEKILIAVNARNKALFIEVLTKRLEGLSESQTRRVKRVLKKIKRIRDSPPPP
jgi:hypothetical protein